jgi:quercetin dioxygenase-like cupin family protein
MPPQPFVMAPKDYPKPLHVRGDEITVLASGEATGGAEIFVQSGPEGSGPPPHMHPWDESFYVISGTLDFGIGEERHVAGPGTLVHLPAGTTHWFRFREFGQMLSMTNKPAAARMFTEIDAAKHLPPEELSQVALRYGLTRP